MAVVYGVIQTLHLVFGLFYALLTVAAIRGLSLHVIDLRRKWRERAAGPDPGAERLYQQLDWLRSLRQDARQELLAKTRKLAATRLRQRIRCIGPIRTAPLIALIDDPPA